MTADARTVALHVETAGRGRPLVLLHGWALHAGLFAPIVPALARAHRVHAVDLPGHGRSPPPPAWTLPAVVDALESTFADAPSSVDVLGWSLGGLVALAWAHAAPRRVARLVLVGTTPRFTASADWPHAMDPRTLHRFADELRVAYRATLQRFVTLQVQGSEAGRTTLAALREALFDRGTPDPSVLAHALAALADADVRALLPAIAQPALVVSGERDTLVPWQASDWLARRLPRATSLAIAGAAHAPFLSHREAFLAPVLDFLAR
ncbi:MAG: pimeloyl-[acyl-carrier protein] methyl ester esterase [Betaproteobacteria bacterium]|nr:MAG: pimeloyl-[acyl-carrier protein] methyl ester esterase [Betaproteobacteria bacterium]